ncbi:HNH endonuclease signature motif containing protein [Sinorhizobium medicae]
MANRITACGCSVPKGTKCAHEQTRTTARQKANDVARGTAAERGYDKDWWRLRHAFLQAHPTCCVPGCEAKATHVDHIKSIRDAPRLRLVESNLRSMCLPCHSRRTARDQSQNWGRKR